LINQGEEKENFLPWFFSFLRPNLKKRGVAMIKQIFSEIKAELKPAKLIALVVVMAVIFFALSWISKKNAAFAKINPIPVK